MGVVRLQFFRRLFSPGRKFGFWPVLVIFIVGMVVGGMTTHILAPKMIRAKQPPAQNIAETTEAGSPATDTVDDPVVAVASQVGPAIVGISSEVTQSDLFSTETVERTGSGAIIDSQGHIVTNNHVISGTPEVRVTLFDGRETVGKVIGADPQTDLAVVKVDTRGLTVAKLGDSDKVKVGERAIAIGNPLGVRFARSVTSGVISGINRLLATEEGRQFQLLQTDAAINPGNSGGPLINSRGEIIGINTIKISQPGFEGLGFAIPSNTVRQVTDQLIRLKRVIRPGLGVLMAGDINRMLAEEFSLPVASGVLIKVVRGGPAQKAGLADGDIISMVNGKAVRNGTELQSEVSRHKVGDSITVTAFRETATSRWQKSNLKVRLAELR
jgi:serine protease Do